MKYTIRFVSLLFTISNLVACGQGGGSTAFTEPKAGGDYKPSQILNDALATHDSKHEKFRSWSQYVDTFDDSDRAYLINISSNFYGLFNYDTPSGQDNLMRLGFPSPEDLVKYRHFDNQVLRSKSESGDLLAKALYSERIADKIEKIQKANGVRGLGEVTALYTTDQMAEMEEESIYAYSASAELLRFHPNAFNSYLFGRVYASTHGSYVPIAASVALARDLGDDRATAVLERLYADVNGDPALTLNTYLTMKKIAGLN